MYGGRAKNDPQVWRYAYNIILFTRPTCTEFDWSLEILWEDISVSTNEMCFGPLFQYVSISHPQAGFNFAERIGEERQTF